MSIEELRREIDEVDKRILSLLAKRASIARMLGEAKRRARLGVADLHRELEVLSNVRSEALKLKLNPEAVEAIYRGIIALCSAVQKPIRVAFLGPSGSFSEEAARRFFSIGAFVELKECMTVRDLFASVEKGEADHAVVPVENSLSGSIAETLDLLLEADLKVCGEVKHRIELNLIAKPGLGIADVKAVASHPQALAQCREFLRRELGDVKLIETASTSQAVKLSLEGEGVAAVGSRLAAEIYGGEIIFRSIEDCKNNYTRFLLLGHEDLPLTEGCKTSIVLPVTHKAGGLSRAFEVLVDKGINIMKVEPRPIKGRAWEYFFFIDIEGHREEEACREALRELRNSFNLVKVLGSYKEVA
ncbi:MAG: prephenate dehydratase [Candidatus Nezhaarchaeota archaeon]|nr:prephenate dehydratase [Candidatus Nezhaarchaeota archaeon]